MMEFKDSPLVPKIPKARDGDLKTDRFAGVDFTGLSPAEMAEKLKEALAALADALDAIEELQEAVFDGEESRIERLEEQLGDATIEAVCNEDGTITVTLTLGGEDP